MSTAKSDSPAPPPIGGIQITQGVIFRIPVGGLQIEFDADGLKGGEVRAVELRLDTCVHWLEIAMEQLGVAKVAHEALIENRAEGAAVDSSFLDREFRACMQAAVAAATFFEALYAASVQRTRDASPPKVLNLWGRLLEFVRSLRITRRGTRSERRPTRHKQVAEQLKNSFGLRRQGIANLKNVLRDIYKYRDEAVHPSNVFSPPYVHPELNVGVERRFAMFGYAHVQLLVRAALAFSKILPSRDMSKRPKEMQEFAAYLLKACEPLYARWETMYGALIEGAQPPPPRHK